MRNERGAVLVWVTLMIVILLAIVGVGLDSGQLSYSRNTGQAAVDAAALSAVSALPQAKAANNSALVEARATAAFLSKNDYTGSAKNPITSTNVSYVQYDFTNNTVTNYGVALTAANGVRVALEGADAIASPAFLTPLFKLLGSPGPASNNVSVSAVSVIHARPSIPIALWQSVCQGSAPVPDVEIAQQNPVNGNENSCWTTYLDKSSGAYDIKSLFKSSATCDALPVGEIYKGIPIYENKGQVASVYEIAKNFFLVDAPTKDRDWIIPVIVGTGNCNEKNPQPIVDWAKIRVSEVGKHGSDSYIKATITCQQDINLSADALCFSHRLVREKSKAM